MRPALAALVCALLAASAGAQGYPSEPVRIVVPFKQTAKLDILVIQYKGTGASPPEQFAALIRTDLARCAT